MRNRPSFYRQKAVWISLLLSLLLHLTVAYLGRKLWMEKIAPEAFRARLALITPRFQPRRLAVVGREMDLPRVEMEYLDSPQAEPQQVLEGETEVQAPALPQVEVPLAPLALKEVASGAKEDEPLLERVEMLRPSELGLADSIGIPSMDLLRVVDMARANKDRAVVMIDPGSRRDLLGYINLTQLQVYGAGSRGVLHPLARYLRDHTRLLVKVQEVPYEYFLSEDLLKDPIHLLIQGKGLTAYRDEVLTYFSQEEKALLEHYLRGGGFLFIEGGNRYLREMVGHLKGMLGTEGKLFVISPSHPLYHSFYDFGGGFPGEDKTALADRGADQGWYYPAQQDESEPAQEQAFSVTSQFPGQQDEEERPTPRGLWGVELDGELVAVLSDLGLAAGWARSFSVDEEETASLPSLMSGTNIVAYALTRPRGLAIKEAKPVWMSERPVVPLRIDETMEPGEGGEGPVDPELLAVLDASLAIVQAPLGTEIGRRGLEVRLNGRYSLELIKGGLHGLLLHNLPAGRHWLEIEYGGKSKQLEIELEGGKVATVTFGLNRFAFLSQLHMQCQERQVKVDQWLEQFSDLRIEEVYLDEERQVLEPAESF